MRKYTVCMGEEPVGEVWMEDVGLYRRILCRCRLSGEVMCRLWVSWDEESLDLGVLCPVGGEYGLERKIPAKQLGQGDLKFYVAPKRIEKPGLFVAVYPDEPFAYIQKLGKTTMEVRNGQPGILIE